MATSRTWDDSGRTESLLGIDIPDGRARSHWPESTLQAISSTVSPSAEAAAACWRSAVQNSSGSRGT
jgi:hypothetical protein